MCTSFVNVTNDNCFIAMNFDNNGMKYNIHTKKKDWFIVYVNAGNYKVPSFGVHSSGIFFNDFVVEECVEGKYRRGKGIVHMTRFLNEIISGNIQVDDIQQYLQDTKIVNVPDWSNHCMLCGTNQTISIIEPGRGNMHVTLKPNEYEVMTNFSLLDKNSIPCERYVTASKLLSQTKDMTVEKAFSILDTVKQSEGEWKTAFSIVFDKAKKKVYYCIDQAFDDIKEFDFQS